MRWVLQLVGSTSSVLRLFCSLLSVGCVWNTSTGSCAGGILIRCDNHLNSNISTHISSSFTMSELLNPPNGWAQPSCEVNSYQLTDRQTDDFINPFGRFPRGNWKVACVCSLICLSLPKFPKSYGQHRVHLMPHLTLTHEQDPEISELQSSALGLSTMAASQQNCTIRRNQRCNPEATKSDILHSSVVLRFFKRKLQTESATKDNLGRVQHLRTRLTYLQTQVLGYLYKDKIAQPAALVPHIPTMFSQEEEPIYCLTTLMNSKLHTYVLLWTYT